MRVLVVLDLHELLQRSGDVGVVLEREARSWTDQPYALAFSASSAISRALSRSTMGGPGSNEEILDLDTTTPGGRLVLHVFTALAAFIRELVIAGIRDGLAEAPARGASAAGPASPPPRA
ncbi:recombinase family protein [Nonomuraea roseola]|uniref:Recombinase family protein n=1 Tax=Nonomuraea roseola TaxID=46179 RepID=A0ABV5PTY4_9ACTN